MLNPSLYLSNITVRMCGANSARTRPATGRKARRRNHRSGRRALIAAGRSRTSRWARSANRCPSPIVTRAPSDIETTLILNLDERRRGLSW